MTDSITTTEADERCAERASWLGITQPQEGIWLRVDGVEQVGSDGELYREPERNDILDERLEQMGHYCTNNGLLCFIGPDGYAYLGRGTQTNYDIVEGLGYRKGSIYVPLSSRTPELTDPEFAAAFKTMTKTPEHPAEQLEWALWDRDIGSARDALTQGVDFSTLRQCLLGDYLAGSDDEKSLELAQLLLDHQYPPDGLERARPLLRQISANWRSDNPRLTRLLLDSGASPFYRGSSGVPVFVPYSNYYDNKQYAEYTSPGIIIEAALKDARLTHAERKLMEWHKKTLLGEDTSRETLPMIESVWRAAHQFEPDPDRLIPALLPDLIAPMLSPASQRGISFQKNLPFAPTSNYIDMVEEFTRIVALPQMLLDFAENEGITLDDDLLSSVKPGMVVKQLTAHAGQALFKGLGLDKVEGLSRAWHAPETRFPDALRPLAATGEWRPLTQDKIHAVPEDVAEGLSIHVLTTSKELTEEGRILNHCVGSGGYIGGCLEGTTHILSVRDANGTPLSTIELRVENGELVQRQHYGHDNSTPPENEQEAAFWFLQEIRGRRIPLSSRHGETEESKARKTRPLTIQEVGYELTQANVDAAFDEYKSPRRRAREYNAQTEKYDIVGKTDFISGPSKNQDAAGWMAVSGLRAQMAELAPALLAPLKEAHEARLAAQARNAIETSPSPAPVNTSLPPEEPEIAAEPEAIKTESTAPHAHRSLLSRAGNWVGRHVSRPAGPRER